MQSLIYNASIVYETIKLRQCDFDSGTYRIKKGANIIIEEDICFDPIPGLEAKEKINLFLDDLQ